MKRKNLIIWLTSCMGIAIGVIFFINIQSCKDIEQGPTGPQTLLSATISGIINQQIDSLFQPLSGVVVIATPSFGQPETTQTTTQGEFSFSVQFPERTDSGMVTLTATKTDYYSRNDLFSIRAGKDYSRQYVMVRRDTSGGGHSGVSSSVASLVFLSSSNTFMNVKGVGGLEIVTLTFEARDSVGIPISLNDRVKVRFRLAPALSGGEYLSPVTAYTGSNGRVTTTLNTGVKSGIVQVEARIDSPIVIRTNSLAIPIHSGPPDLMYFSLSASRYNFPALGISGSQDTITVRMGDRWSNPVPVGTSVSFATRAGLIQPSATSDMNGKALVILLSGNPQPSNGFAYVVAQTVGDTGTVVQDSIRILFSGKTYIVPNDTSFTVLNGGTANLSFRVFDQYRHPLAGGTRVQVSLSGNGVSELAYSGDLDRTLPDTQDSSYTSFSITLRDTSVSTPTPDKNLFVTLSVTSPNGNAVYSIPGILRGAGGMITPPAKAASISLYSISNNQIAVHGSGGNETSIINFLVLDRTGKPVPQDSALVSFQLQGVNASVYPPSARTDAQGRVQTTLTSGTIAGVVQVIALTDTGGPSPIKSSPVPVTVAGGLPDSSHFTIAVAKFNLPGLLVAGLTDAITVYVGDKYGNPVQQNTAVYFTTNGGLINPSALTNLNGVASTILQTGDPIPPVGRATITASTVSESGGKINGNANVVFSGTPIITTNPNSIIVDDGGAATLSYSVKDINGNPISAGNTIQVSLDGGPLIGELELSGDVSTTMGDRLSGGTDYSVTIRDKQPLNLTQGGFSVVINVGGPNGSAKIIVPGTLNPSANPPISNIVLDSLSSRLLTVRNTGQIDSTNLVFKLQDDRGRVIPVANIPVDFMFYGATGSFTPSHAYTNSNGQVRTTFHSGSDTGTVSIVAQVGEVVSRAVNVTILAGPPYIMRITMVQAIDTSARLNFPGAADGYSGNIIGESRVDVRDRYGNPIIPGSRIINFATNGGVFPNNSSYTNRSGLAKVDWYGGVPSPPNGIATITVSTIGENNLPISQTATVTYSGNATISSTLANSFVFSNAIDTSISFIVSDTINGNPLSKGATIQVSSAGANSVILSGDVNVTAPDTKDKNTTRFSFRFLDTNSTVTNDRNISITIQVGGPNGSKRLTITGTLKGATPPPFRVIALESINPLTITVTGVGAQDSSVLQYVLQDSAGHQIQKSGIPIGFFIASGVDGSFSPNLAMTDAAGRVRTTFHSGTFAGVVTVKAQSSGIISAPQNITVEGGPPSQMYFSLKMLRPPDPQSKVNFAGAFPSLRQQIGTAQVQAKDRYGNVVRSRTPVLFTSDAGSIQGVAYTDNNGVATASWFSGNPIPSGGNARVLATALGEGSVVVADSADVAYSGQAVITGGLASGLVLKNMIDTTVTFKVSDSNGNPLAQGSNIVVTASGTGASSVILSGDVNVTLPDTRDTNYTKFSFRLIDSNSVITSNRPLTVSIAVTGPNGTATKLSADTLQGTIGGGRSRLPGAIALLSVSNTNIQVIGTGGLETSTLVWEVRDSLGVPVDASYKVKFSFMSTPGGGAFISPDSGYCNPLTGRINSVIHSGTISGVLQVLASVITPTDTIRSTPVRVIINAGLPDQTHFSIGASPINVAGLLVNGETSIISVIVGDRYGNPVAENSAVYFTPTEGIVTTNTGFTDITGRASVTFMSGNPRSADGFGYVIARTSGEGGVTVTDSVRILLSGAPIIDSVTYMPDSTVTDSTSFTVRFRVYDVNHNPMAANTSISISIQGASAIASPMQPSATLPDTQSPYWTTFYAIITKDKITVPVVTGSFTGTIRVSGPNGTANKNFVGIVK